MRGAGAIAIAFVALAGALGCGDSAEQDYAEQVDRVGNSLVARASELTDDAAREAAAAEVAQDFARLSRAAEGQANELATIEPPEKVKAQHDRLVTAMLSFAASSRRAVDAVRSRDAKALKRAARELSPNGAALTEINDAIAAINRAL